MAKTNVLERYHRTNTRMYPILTEVIESCSDTSNGRTARAHGAGVLTNQGKFTPGSWPPFYPGSTVPCWATWRPVWPLFTRFSRFAVCIWCFHAREPQTLSLIGGHFTLPSAGSACFTFSRAVCRPIAVFRAIFRGLTCYVSRIWSQMSWYWCGGVTEAFRTCGRSCVSVLPSGT
jgi:hypothetical protein